MRTLLADHPLVTHKLTLLRDEATDTATFRRLADELVTLLAYEATREIRLTDVTVQTPVGTAVGAKLADPMPLIVPVLRAGIGMLDGMTRLLPMASVGFVGMVRDEESLVASTYANRLPADLTGREVFVLDPMLATGGTLETVFGMLIERGAGAVTGVSLLAAPEGIARLEVAFGDDGNVPIRVVTAALDERLNDRGFIVPGLSDAGDRLFGEI
jgi:uracil phosphoribosyltransferase